ncbi:MAG: diacylglycerol kinase family protein [Clostridia bacterium]|nr:diacylglycerol kinase family protein [Clostridia bacterium]
MKYVLYNPMSDNSCGAENARELLEKYPSDKYVFIDFTTITDGEIFELLAKEDGDVILTGGDGTLNRFVNILGDNVPDKNIYFYPAGSGNDFMNDIKGKNAKELILLNGYIKTLPVIEVNGKSYRFINGVGYGVDGYSCEVIDSRKKATGKKGSYSLEALKGLLYSYEPGKAKVTVDGVTTEFENVWMVSVMNGRYFGGGVMIAPMQDRLNEENTVSVLVVTSKSRVKTLLAFPSIFKGKHMKYTEIIKAFTGKNISVEVDRPSPLQVDGDVISGVTHYSVKSGEQVKAKEKELI